MHKKSVEEFLIVGVEDIGKLCVKKGIQLVIERSAFDLHFRKVAASMLAKFVGFTRRFTLDILLRVLMIDCEDCPKQGIKAHNVMKICSKCKMEKDEANFTPSEYKSKSGWCRDCVSSYNKQWSKDNAERNSLRNKEWREANPEQNKARTKKWSDANPERVKANNKKWREENAEYNIQRVNEWRQANIEKVNITRKQYVQDNRDLINQAQRDRYNNDPAHRNRCIISSRVNDMLKSQGLSKGGKSFLQYVDWTPEELWNHLLECMKQPGNEWMTPNNQGKYDPETWDDNDSKTWTWQLDHIIPHSDLNYDSLEHENFKKAWSLTNLRPLNAKQNLIDGVKRVRHKKG